MIVPVSVAFTIFFTTKMMLTKILTRAEKIKIALVVFYPYRCATGTQLNGSHWPLFNRERQLFKKGWLTQTCQQEDLIFYKTSKTETFYNMTLKIKDIVMRNAINKLDTYSKHSNDKQTSLDIKETTDIEG